MYLDCFILSYLGLCLTLFQILTFLDVVTLTRISQCNKMFSQLGGEDVLWRLLCNETLRTGQKKPKNLLWKEFYKRIYCFRRGVIYPAIHTTREKGVLLLGTDPNRLFQVKTQITLNGHNSVHRAIHTSTRETVCISKIDYQEGMLPFIKEKAKLLTYSDSPYVVSQYGIYFDGNFVWLVGEYCTSGSLRQHIDLGQHIFSEIEIAYVMYSVLNALSFIHSHNRYHGSISASSIMITHGRNGRVFIKLREKGILNSFSEWRLGLASAQSRKVYWKPPEYTSSAEGDIWSLGITCLELAEGRPPHYNVPPTRARTQIANRPPPNFLHPTQWSNKFRSFLEQCLMKDKASRPSADELLKHPFIVDNFVKYRRLKTFKRTPTAIRLKNRSISRRRIHSGSPSSENSIQMSNTEEDDYSFGLTLSSSFVSMGSTEDSHDL